MNRLYLLLTCLTILSPIAALSQEIFWINQKDACQENYFTTANKVSAIDSNRYLLYTSWSNDNWGYQTHKTGNLICSYRNNKRSSQYFNFFKTSYRSSPGVSHAYKAYTYSKLELGQAYTSFHHSKFQYLNIAANTSKLFEFQGVLISYNINKIDGYFYALVSKALDYRPGGGINYRGLYSDTLYLLRFSEPNQPYDTLGIYRHPIKTGDNYNNYVAYTALDFQNRRMHLYRSDTVLHYNLDLTQPIGLDSIGSSNFYHLNYWWFLDNFPTYTLFRGFDSTNSGHLNLHLVKNQLLPDSTLAIDTLFSRLLVIPKGSSGYSSHHVDQNENLYLAVYQKLSETNSSFASVIYKFDNLGKFIWKQAFFKDSTLSKVNYIDLAPDGTLYAAGTVYGPNKYSYYYLPWYPFVIKFPAEHPVNLEHPLNSRLTLYPNPADSKLNIASSQEFKSLRVSDNFGKNRIGKDFQPTSYYPLKVERLESGHYILELYLTDGNIITAQFVISR